MSYKDLEIWKRARRLSIDIHKMSLQLPHFELYETGRQIRKSSKSIRSNIVEGYGRRRYQSDYVRFLIYSQSSLDETRDHLETLFETGSLRNEEVFTDISSELDLMGKKLFQFTRGVENWNN